LCVWTPPSGRERLYIGRGLEWVGREETMYGFWSIEWAENTAKDLKEVLCQYGLEKDQQALWAVGVRKVDDIAWMSEAQMRDARLTGSFEQYVAMQEGEFAEDDEGVREAQPSDFGPQ
jgi:hypothetical protein